MVSFHFLLCQYLHLFKLEDFSLSLEIERRPYFQSVVLDLLSSYMSILLEQIGKVETPISGSFTPAVWLRFT